MLSRSLQLASSPHRLLGTKRLFLKRKMSATPRIVASHELPSSEAKWVKLRKLEWEDQDCKKRQWECAERTTRGSSGIDAVAVLAILRSTKNVFAPSTVIIEQYRPPVDSYVIELPAGLIDEGETPEQAAIRELEEETGFKSDKVLESTPLLACDPGMTTANMKMVALSVTFENGINEVTQKLEAGEHIIKKVVELGKLNDELKAYATKGFIIDARLSNFAVGYELAERIKNGSLFE